MFGISHIALKVDNMEESLHFYCKILGFQQAFDIKDEDGQPWIEYVKVGTGQFIELFYNGRTKPENIPDKIGVDHLCFEVQNMEEVVRELKEKGIKLDVEPKKGPDNNYQCWLKDPDGNRIELMQIEKDSPHWKWYN